MLTAKLIMANAETGLRALSCSWKCPVTFRGT
jgi:hypothetical protein